MENILKIYYEKSINRLLVKSLKQIVADTIGSEDFEFKNANNGFSFIYDDEIDGGVQIIYGDKNNITGYIEIKADYPWDAVELYNAIISYIVEEASPYL